MPCRIAECVGHSRAAGGRQATSSLALVFTVLEHCVLPALEHSSPRPHFATAGDADGDAKCDVAPSRRRIAPAPFFAEAPLTNSTAAAPSLGSPPRRKS